MMVEWESFAKQSVPASETMSVPELRDHSHDLLLAIADNLEDPRSERQRHAKLQDDMPALSHASPSAIHGGLRHESGFDVVQLSAEYRALRASVLRLWLQATGPVDSTTLEDLRRFDEAVDQGLAEALMVYAQHAARSRDTFLAVLGHDLRNPLNALISCVRILESPKGASSKDRTLQIASMSIASMNEMITDLLEYTRTRLGRGLEMKPRFGNFSAVCQEAFAEVSAAYPHRRLECDVPGYVSLKFDRARMRKVVINLLSNGVHHGSEDFPVLLRVYESGLSIRLIVTNKGAPIPPNVLQVIFDPLVQVGPTSSKAHDRPATSLGLGLFIAREIVLGHGGKISVTSSEVDGTAFKVEFPLSTT